MARRNLGILAFGAIWLTVLLVPSLRLMLQLQAQDAVFVPKVRHDGMLGGGVWDKWGQISRPTRAQLDQLAARHPDKAEVMGQIAFVKANLDAMEAAANASDEAVVLNVPVPPVVQGLKNTTRRLDQLIEQFPNVPWLVAARLRPTTIWTVNHRMAGELEDSRAPGQPPVKWPPPNFSKADVQQAIAIARRGRQLEPNNSFHDWMLALFLFDDYQDAAALAVIHQAALKTEFNDYTLEDVRTAVAMHQMLRPLLAEEKLTIAGGELLPHFARIRHVARLVTWRAILLERAGQHARALQLYGDVSRMGAAMRRHSDTMIGRLVGEAVQSIAWAGDKAGHSKAKLTRSTEGKSGLELRRLLAQNFVAYATAHGRDDLARQAQLDLDEIIRVRTELYGPSGVAGEAEFHGIYADIFKGPALMTATSHWWACVSLLMQMVPGALLWLLLGLPLLWARRRQSARDLGMGELAENRIGWPDVAGGVIVCACITAGLLSAALWMGAEGGAWQAVWQNGEQNTYPLETINILRQLVAATPVLLGLFYCTLATLWRRRRQLRESRKAIERAKVPFEQRLDKALRPRDAAYLGRFALKWGVALGVLAACSLAIVSDPEANTSPFLAVMAFLIVVELARWMVRWAPVARLHGAVIVLDSLRWYRQTLGALLLVASVAYLALSLAALPARRTLNVQVDALIEHGEMAILQAGVSPKSR